VNRESANAAGPANRLDKRTEIHSSAGTCYRNQAPVALAPPKAIPAPVFEWHKRNTGRVLATDHERQQPVRAKRLADLLDFAPGMSQPFTNGTGVQQHVADTRRRAAVPSIREQLLPTGFGRLDRPPGTRGTRPFLLETL